MRIATLANAAVVHTRRWVEHFRARGHDVRLFSLEAPPPGLSATRLPHLPLPGVLRYPLAVPALQRALAAFAPDLVDAHFVPNYGVMAALAGRRPYTLTAWGSDLLVAAGRDPFQRARARFALTRAALVLCDAENLADAARRAGAPPERVRAIPWGVDRSVFRPGPAREPGLVFSARMHEPVYDLATVIEGCARLFETHPQAHVVFAGDGVQRVALEQLAAARLPADRHRFVGRLATAELAAWLARAQVYVSASRSDSTSQSLLEAMAAGAVPVVSDIAGNREWVRAGSSARLFPVGDAGALARELRAVLDDPTWAAAARAEDTRIIDARGDWNVNLARIERLLEAVAAGRPLAEAGA